MEKDEKLIRIDEIEKIAIWIDKGFGTLLSSTARLEIARYLMLRTKEITNV